MAIPDNKADKLVLRVEFNRPTTADEFIDLAKAFTHLADQTGVTPVDIELGPHEYDDDKQYASWETEGLG